MPSFVPRAVEAFSPLSKPIRSDTPSLYAVGNFARACLGALDAPAADAARDRQLRGWIESIARAVDRSSEVMRRLGGLYRHGETSREPTCVRSALAEALELVQPLARRMDAGIETVVRDEGSGPEVESLERLFEPFYSTKQLGTGPGLPISKTIVEAHGGTVGFRRRQPHGAVCRFTLPETPPVAEPSAGPVVPAAREP